MINIQDNIDNTPWLSMECAPRDGTVITLTWMEDGKPQEIYSGFEWCPNDSNPLVQSHNGIWGIRNKDTGQIMMTWCDEGDGAPTHWRRTVGV